MKTHEFQILWNKDLLGFSSKDSKVNFTQSYKNQDPPPSPPPLLCEHGHKSCTYVRSKSWRSLEAGQTSLQEFLIWSTSTRWKAKSTMFWTRGPYIRDAIGQILNSPCQHHGNCLPTAQVTFLQNTDNAFFVNIKFLSAGNVSKTLRFCSSFIFL